MTHTELRQAVSTRIAAHSDWSDRRLATMCGVSRDLVADVRRDLVSDGRIAADEWRQGRDGKVYRQFPRHSCARRRQLASVVRRLSKLIDRLDRDTYLRADPVLRGLFHDLVAHLHSKAKGFKREGTSEVVQSNGG